MVLWREDENFTKAGLLLLYNNNWVFIDGFFF